MSHHSKKISLFIFLISIFVLLAVLTASWLFKIYTEHTNYSTGETRNIVQCNDYSYKIDELVYQDGHLSFTITNSLGDPFDFLSVEAGENVTDIELYNLISGTSQDVELDVPSTDMLLFYPQGCKEHNKKTFSVA